MRYTERRYGARDLLQVRSIAPCAIRRCCVLRDALERAVSRSLEYILDLLLFTSPT